jgi:phosphoglycolate phosphatase
MPRCDESMGDTLASRAGAIRLAVFDLDGTLVDSRRDLADATNALLRELGRAPLDVDEVASMVGDGAAALVRRALAAARLPADTPGALARFLRLYDERLVATTAPYPGIVEALRELEKKVMLAVLTNKPGRATVRLLGALALDRFFARAIGGDTPLGRKPDPAGLLHLATAAGAMPADTVLVGDSHVDVETARRAGTRICVAAYGFGYPTVRDRLTGNELIAQSPSGIAELLLRNPEGPGAFSARTTRGAPTRRP